MKKKNRRPQWIAHYMNGLEQKNRYVTIKSFNYDSAHRKARAQIGFDEVLVSVDMVRN